MGLTSILAAVEKRVVEVVGGIGDRVPNFGFGENAKYKTEALPRVTWIPVQGPISAAKRSSNADQPARQRWLRSLQVQMRVWAEDYDSAEALAGHVFAAFAYTRNGNHSVRSEAWDLGTTLKHGVLGIFIVEINMPFTDEPLKIVDGTTTPLGTDLTEEIG